MKTVGFMAVIRIVSYFVFIAAAFSGIQSLQLERYFRITPEKQTKFKLIIIMLSVAIGYGCSEFFLSFIDNVRNLMYLY
ncbi:DUF1146 family protein [Ligilactobacillus ceti]|uniref:DUF1146 domain-containing protein n=1 Tax=Ligilactobacillus ceti DSM 22408 TaxID=1122146 RepID=A0A0R2KR60_9LACO|nr:DUF1146 family protein [Ligilactobacillus ceti]KRN89002.1 hypothetical protein IV53_GL000975 [Ligilactobacillus ceti DSM 22408]